MRKFRSTKSDSLDLLLDTICNAFGAIVLITILITLLTSDAKNRLQDISTSTDKELIERQIASVKSDIQEAEEYLERQATSVSVDPSLATGLNQLRASLQIAKDKNASAWAGWEKTAVKLSGSDPEADRVLGEKVSVTSRLSKLKTETRALDEKLKRLKNRFETLKRERSEIVAGKAEQLRLLKEQSERSGNVYFLLKHNEVFPLYFARSGSFTRNDGSLEWQTLDEETTRVIPKAGQGIDVSNMASALQETLTLMKKEGKYAALNIDSKSVAVYRALRLELLKYGLLFGWRHQESAAQDFTTGRDGMNPPPPL
jgi:cell division protein ZapA (FtsZ GTPase activity inhibitor)